MNRKRSRFIKTQLIFLLSLTLSFAVASGNFAPKKQLTITNRSVMPLRVYVDSDFSDSPIPTPPNVSIIGTWASGSGLATEFRRVGDEYIGTIVSCPDSFAKFGYYSGMEWIKLRRTNFDIYKGTRIKLDSDSNKTEAKFSCQVEKGNELFPHNWFKQ